MKNWQYIIIIIHSESFSITKYQMTSHSDFQNNLNANSDQ